ncbi:ShlB/FhaC/HecB family hemolysin secretion/activation protein [Burkholderia pseudomallei]|uniref:ShlB/FhaC/HecB family hemolysin secretion/activation protein n=1 Tax=Burkholderia pseudomallei TaxID=28450 RepID=UPI00105DD5E5|nr:ShlB/FhaC/HecB family hemolysin secretion/activation protein [Burkholderia pseudomallei]
MKYKKNSLGVFAGCVISATALAQTVPQVPNAGAITRDTERPTLPRNASSGDVETPAPASPKGAAPGGAQVEVKSFRIAGNTSISSDALIQNVPELHGAIGRQLDLAGLEAVADAVTKYYRGRGFPVAVTYVEPQAVADGVVTLTVLEGKVSKVVVKPVPGYVDERLSRFARTADCLGAGSDCGEPPVERRRVERAAGILGDLPGIRNVTGTLSPGDEPGSSTLTLNPEPGPKVQGYVGADNYGNRYTGKGRFLGRVQANNLAGIGDALGVDLVTSGRNLINGGVDYSVPIGYDGWRLGFRYSRLDYVLRAPFDALDARGTADILGAYMTYPALRSVDCNLDIRIGVDSKWLDDKVLGESAKRRLTVGSLGFTGNAIDGLFGGGYTGYGATVSAGDNRPGGLADVPNGPDHGFTKFNYFLLRDQTLAYLGNDVRLSLFGSFRGQYSGEYLSSVETFALGGPGGVRAYPVGEAPGDKGWLGTAELRVSTHAPWVGSDVTFAVFRDMGRSTTQAPGLPAATRFLAGNGISLEFNRRDTYLFKLAWALRDKNGSPAQSDSDSRSRLWAQFTYLFP